MSNSIVNLKEQLKVAQHTLAESERCNGDQDAQLNVAANESEERRKKIDQAHHEWMSALDRIEDAIFLHDRDFRILRCNNAYQRYAGLPYKQIIGQRYFDVFPKTDGPLHSCLEATEKLMPEGVEEELQVGELILRLHAYAITDEQGGGYLYSVHTIEDITQRKNAETLVYLEKQKLEAALNSMSDAIFISDNEGRFIHFNEAFATFHKFKNIEECAKTLKEYPDFLDVYSTSGELLALEQWAVPRALRGEVGNNAEFTLHRKDTGETWIGSYNFAPICDKDGNIIGSVVSGRDITERKRTEQQINQLTKMYATLSLCNHTIVYANTEQELFEKICEHSVQSGGMKMAWIGLIDPKRNFVRRVASYGDENHYLEEIAISTLATQPFGKGPTGTAIREDRPVWCQDFLNNPSTELWHERAKAAGWRASAALPIHQNGKVIGAFMLYSDQLNVFDTMMQKLIVEIAMDVSFALDTFEHESKRQEGEDNLQKTEKLLEEMSAMALIGGWDIEVKTGKGTWTKESALIYDMEPTNMASIEIFLQVFEGEWLVEIQTAMEKVVHNELPFTLNLPMKTAKGNKKWVRVIGTPAYQEGKVVHIHGSVQDVSILKSSEEALHESLIGTIQAMASTVEMRDPYTSGHQKRVAVLSSAIAKMMGMDENRIEGLHLAALIHDLGKIHIPAEILSKPSKLSSIEFMLIQTHPQAGYDILKNIKFPWPIADIILQHHEKLDGNGYPRGIRGDSILLEAKIISVADVVEAISSHRPYRAALGIEVALDEIKRGRGSIYEASVVDACVKLFVEKGFSFSSQCV